MPRSSRETTSYLFSLPERVLRSASALAGGLLRELGEVTLPRKIRQGRLYTNLVDLTLRFLIEQVGQVEGVYPTEDRLGDEFFLRRTAGSGLELAGILAFRASPVWVLAALADITGAGRALLADITDSLKERGMLDPRREFHSVDEMLDGLEQSAGKLAEAINAPPLDVASLRNEWANLRRELGKLPPRSLPSIERISRSWQAIRREAAAQKRSTFEISSLMAMSVVASIPEKAYWLSRASKLAGERTGRMFADTLLEHYSSTLSEIRDIGFRTYLRRQFRPYLRAAAAQFQLQR